MSDFQGQIRVPSSADIAVDQGLRKFMLGVYNKLFLGLLVAAALAYVTSAVPAVVQLMYNFNAAGQLTGFTPLGWGVNFAPLVLLLGSSFFMKNPTSASASLLYWLVVATMGASMGVWLLIYTGGSAVLTLGVTSAAFGALSLFGYTTKKNLTGLGTFLIMGVIGLIIASIVNIFLQSPIMYLIISAAGVLIFSGLIAWDTQRLKMTYYAIGQDPEMAGVATSYGALSLFINFLNLFQFLLAFVGVRR